ncbi:hypothetical protein [Thalassotalea sp. PS06]|uniref:hypothetical protein n=1 Tax=Thalassotalea sp. PS06 TaxID=2594005 RepID=UPI001162B169|nr:hypothetical protein [Thalassotalea sp. PS06]QDP00698.1 hypothetical protein FNC98_04625 [Thalassotalea sp. PS06]
MNKILILLSVITLNAHASNIIDIDCGEYNEALDTNKSRYKFTIETEVEAGKEALERFFRVFGEEPTSRPQEIYTLLDRSTAKIKKSFLRRSTETETEQFGSEVVVEHQKIQPHIVLSFEDNLIISYNNGEFGGNLLLIDSNDEVKSLKAINVEDIYRMPIGIVITSGLAHLSDNYGYIYILHQDLTLEKYFGLIGMPRTSWLLENGDLIINSYPKGSQLLTVEGDLKRVNCYEK